MSDREDMWQPSSAVEWWATIRLGSTTHSYHEYWLSTRKGDIHTSVW